MERRLLTPLSLTNLEKLHCQLLQMKNFLQNKKRLRKGVNFHKVTILMLIKLVHHLCLPENRYPNQGFNRAQYHRNSEMSQDRPLLSISSFQNRENIPYGIESSYRILLFHVIDMLLQRMLQTRTRYMLLGDFMTNLCTAIHGY